MAPGDASDAAEAAASEPENELLPLKLLIEDSQFPCPYLPGETARLPFQLPLRALTPEEVDQHLALGFRRNGRLLYVPTCPACNECVPIRVPTKTFRPSATQRRVWRKGKDLLRATLGVPEVSDERLALYNKHKRLRNLNRSEAPIDGAEYASFLVDRSSEAFEIQYRAEDQLVGIAITDAGRDSLSAVYTYFDPDFSRWSPGVFSILTQIALCGAWNLSYLYLGLYVAGSEHMRYKSAYLPHERRIGGAWHTFDRSSSA